MRRFLQTLGVISLLCGSMVGLGGCADSGAQLNRPEPYRPTSAPAATQSPDLVKPKAQ